MKRVPASMRTREELTSLIEGRLSTASAKDELVKRATRLVVEGLFVEERRRLKIIPNAFGEQAVLKLMFGALTRAAERWRSVEVTDFERRQIAAIRKELDEEYEAQPGTHMRSSKDGTVAKKSSKTLIISSGG
jgi:hypothetical protein